MSDPTATAVVTAAARVVFERGWIEDDSAFTAGRAIWTPGHLEELHEHYVRQRRLPGTGFEALLRAHLERVSDGGRQLMAELLYLNVLPTHTSASRKRELVGTVLSWSSQQAVIPPDLDTPLESGVFTGGIGFNVGRWRQLVLLIETVRVFKSFDGQERRRLLADPWAFRDVVRGVGEPPEPAQRNALLFLAFPDTFPPVVVNDDRKRIVAAFGAELLSPTGDEDRDLASIHQELVRRAGSPVDFYGPTFKHRWKLPGELRDADSDGTGETDRGQRAWLVRGSNVLGRDLVATWLEDGFVSLRTRPLPAPDSGVSREVLREVVDRAYSDTSYNQRQQKLEELWAFLARITPGDVIATTSQGTVHVGQVTGDPMWVDSPGSRSNLRREVSWESADRGIDVGDLPPALAARMQSQLDVVDLTQQRDDLLARLQVSVPTPPELVLEAATDELAERLLVTRDWLQECTDLLADQKQLIFYGPPGTGKTYLAQALAAHLAAPENVALVQFHPSYSYEDFFEGLRPEIGTGATVGFALKPGPFRRLVDRAREQPGVPHFLIIDEINRGNLAKIFGELYFLLEYRDKAIELLYSGGGDQAFTMPPNVFLIGTMNTADRSIALIDSAMRRRFAFVGLDPGVEPTRSMLGRWLAREQLPLDNAALLDCLNATIDDPDFRIGPSSFMRPAVYRPGGLQRMWRTAILPLLAERHFGDGVDVLERYDLGRLQRTAAAGASAGQQLADDAAAAVGEPGPPS